MMGITTYKEESLHIIPFVTENQMTKKFLFYVTVV